MSNASRLRRSIAAAQLTDSDAAGVELAAMLARLLDEVAGGPLPLQLEVIKVAGPQYLRTLTALGLTKAGRPIAAAEPTAGSAQGVSADADSHRRHRDRFAQRAGGAG